MMRSVAIALLVVVAGCGGDSPTDPLATAAASYDITSVNGSLPALVESSGQNSTSIIGGVLDLDATGTFVEQVVLRHTTPPTSSNTVDRYAGTWTLEGSRLELTDPSRGVQIGQMAAGRITLTDLSGRTIVLQRRN